MNRRLHSQLIALPLFCVAACAPGRSGGSGGIGCSKTSSVLKTPTIVMADSETSFDPNKVANPEQQQSLFYKHFGQFKAKTVGGYLYIQSRNANDVMGEVPADAKFYRCSVLMEFPKRTGEIRAPEIAGSPWNGKSVEFIEADRFPVRSDALKVRLYSAAHCFDYSVNERVVLSLFESQGQNLPEFKKAYVNIDLAIPELEAVKTLRKSLAEKVKTSAITNQTAVDILKAFQPAVRDMNAVFNVPADPSTVTSPTPKQSCMIPLDPNSAADNAKQYTCATYHDMIVLDVEFSNLPASQDAFLRDTRDRAVAELKKTENDRPDFASASAPPIDSPWKDYATDVGFRMFIGQMMEPSCKDFMPPPPPTCSLVDDDNDILTPPVEVCAPITDSEPPPSAASCVSNLYPAIPASEYPKVYTIKFSCGGVSAPDCDEVPVNSLQNLHYMRYMTRERLRTFSSYNMVGSLPQLPADLLSCSGTSSGVCSAKADVETALGKVAEGLTLSSASLAAANFNGSSSPVIKSQKKVDGALAVWKDFFAANDDSNSTNTSSGVSFGGSFSPISSTQSDFFKKQLNPINFLDLHSNFIVQDRALATLPDPKDMDLRRAFLKLPINNIIGLDEFTSFGPDSSTPRPIFIDSWNSGAGDNRGGHFLRFWTTKSQLNTFLDSFTSQFSGVDFDPLDPNSIFVLLDRETVNPLTDFIAEIPTQATLQKGDSGSVFTLDGIPMFALSTVNGEPTSGGAAVAAIPTGVDSDDTFPGGDPVADNGTGGGGPVAGGGKAICK